MPRPWPLVGRDEELRAVARALGPRGDRCGVVLSGPAGVGKTRLAREVVARASRSRTVHWALATQSAREVPFAAFGGILDDAASAGPDVLQRAADLLGCGASLRQPVVAVDDAHLLDELSAALVHRVATRRWATVVLTTRDRETAPDAITALWKDDHLNRIALAPLPDDRVAELLERVLDGPLERASADRLVALARGNALYLRLLVDGERGAGRLTRGRGVWRWTGTSEVSTELRDVVRAQMGDLSSEVRDLVDILALAEPLGLATLDSLSRRSALESAEELGVVQVVEEAGHLVARLAHPMYGEVRRAVAGEAKTRRLRGLIATTVAATDDAHVDLVRRAVLLMESDESPDPDLLLVAAREALEHFDPVLGERLARAAVAGGGGFDARLALAVALSFVPSPDEAEQLLAGLEVDAPTSEDRARIALIRVGNLFWTLRQPSAAEQALDRALAQLPADGPERSALLGMRAAVDASRGRTDSAVATGVPLLDEGRLSDVALVMVAAGVVIGTGVQGRLDVVERAGRAGHLAAAGMFNTFGPHFGLGDWGLLALRLGGRIRAAEALAAEIVQDADDGFGSVIPLSRTVSGHAALAAGRIGDAVQDLREAYAGLTAPHPFVDRTLLLLSQAAAIAGDIDTARRMLTELADIEVAVYVHTQPEELLARGWLAAAEGAVSEATATALEAAELARTMNAPAYEVLALQTVTQYGDPSGVARLEQLSEVVQGPRAAAALAHARALADGDADGLMLASARWEELGDLVAAVDAAAQAAVDHQRRGRTGSGLTAAHRANALAEQRCGGARTPALAAVASPPLLTTREREIVRLAAGGLSNRQIAERLFVSVRTVEGHLYRASQKLGVHERSELAGLMAVEQ